MGGCNGIFRGNKPCTARSNIPAVGSSDFQLEYGAAQLSCDILMLFCGRYIGAVVFLEINAESPGVIIISSLACSLEVPSLFVSLGSKIAYGGRGVIRTTTAVATTTAATTAGTGYHRGKHK